MNLDLSVGIHAQLASFLHGAYLEGGLAHFRPYIVQAFRGDHCP
jgi:hypothetical protein